MRSLFQYLLLMIFLGGCQNPGGSEVYRYGEEFELKLGEEARIGNDALAIEFVDVLEDSRCPSNVTCVWAGNGKVEIRFTRETLRLNTYLDPRDSTISNVNVELLSLKPYPEHPVQFEKEDYKVRILVTEE